METELNQRMLEKLEHIENANKSAIDAFVATYDILEGRFTDISNKVSELKKKFPSMKSDRLMRKVAEYFNFKKK